MRDTCKDWALILLSQLDEVTRARMIFIWWRTWHIRNNIIFGDGKCGIEQSTLFLMSYFEAFQGPKDQPEIENSKGKQPAQNQSVARVIQKSISTETWKKRILVGQS